MLNAETGQENYLARKTWLRRAAVVLVLAAHFTLLVFTAREKSATSDEPYHIARGVSALFSGDFRMSVAHPPLVNVIAALPLLAFRDLEIPYADPAWWNPRAAEPERKDRFSKLILWVHDRGPWRGNRDPLAIIFWTRFPIMVLSVILGALVYFWSARLWGAPGGLFSLLLYAFSPTVLAHASLNTTDLGSALFIFLFALTLDYHLRSPSMPRLLLCGFALGLAQLSKFTAVLLLPLFPLAIFLAQEGPLGRRMREMVSLRPSRPGFLTGIGAWVLILAVSALVIWAGYGFEIHSIHRIELPPAAPMARLGSSLKYLVASILAAVPLLPPTYYFGFARTLGDTEAHFHPLYFLGKLSEQGWWYYYPVLFLIKEPLSLLGLIALSLLAWKKPPAGRRTFAAIGGVFGIGVFVSFMFLNQKNIGIRHLLAVYPFLLVGLGRLARIKWKKWILPLGAWALVLAYVVNGSLAFPDYLVHFNSLVGGPEGGLRYSVVGEDWGQDVMALGKYCRAKGITRIYYKPYGNADAAAYGVPEIKYGCTQRDPGWYAVHVVDLERPLHENEGDCWRDFLARKPVDIIHHTIYIYYLPPVPAPAAPG